MCSRSQGGTSILGGRGGGGGGLGPDIKIRGKIWGKVQPSSPNKRKDLRSSVTTRRKSWERITILGAFEVISEIQRAKFGVFFTYTFGGKIWGSDTANFGAKPPDLQMWKYPPGLQMSVKLKFQCVRFEKKHCFTLVVLNWFPICFYQGLFIRCNLYHMMFSFYYPEPKEMIHGISEFERSCVQPKQNSFNLQVYHHMYSFCKRWRDLV